MTHEQQVEKYANELIGKFTFSWKECDNAKKCAIISVENSIEEWDNIDTYIPIEFVKDRLKFYRDVKKFIERAR
jgi:hypothetical protein